MITNTPVKRVRQSVATLAILTVACAAFAADEPAKPVASVDVHAASNYLAGHDNAVILDVRTPAEFSMSHITGATNIDVQDESFRELAAALDADKTYIVHCTRNPADGRSARALQVLEELGFNKLYSLEGGYVAWKEAELPLTESAN